MAENEQGQEKTEQATPKRREESHKKGQVAKSRELASVAILGGALIYFYFQGGHLLKDLMAMVGHLLTQSSRAQLTADNVAPYFAELSFQVLIMLLPLLLTVVVVSLLANILQVGFIFSTEGVAPKLSKIALVLWINSGAVRYSQVVMPPTLGHHRSPRTGYGMRRSA